MGTTDIVLAGVLLLLFTFWLPTLVYLCCKLGRMGWLAAERQFTSELHETTLETCDGDEEQGG